MPGSELERIHAFELGITERCAEWAEDFDWGTAFFNDSFERAWNFNSIWIATLPPAVTASALAAEADRLQGPHRAHRKIFIEDEDAGARLVDGFKELGWAPHRYIAMVQRRESETAIETTGVEEVDWGTLRMLETEVVRREPYATDEEDVRQLVERWEAVARSVPTRYFMASVDGNPASCCYLFADGSTAQIEDVATLEEYRRRGLAKAVVWRAVEEARRAGNDFVFLVADEDDWPKEMYRKLGFEPVGTSYDFIKVPPGHPGLRTGDAEQAAI